jgi:ubiquinone biosynthesis protein
MRIDLIPYVYGVELSKLFDKVPAFPTGLAIERIEALLGRPINDVFAAFDPEPIGTASVACVYQATLRNGERVAVKVRRPGIGDLFKADCKALEWTLKLMEFATLIPPGLSRNILHEFETMLLEELNFVREARHTELFRRRVLKKLQNVSAPRVYFELSGDDVLTTEYLEGLWLGEMIAGIEQKDPDVLSYIRAYNIDPKIVARRLIRINQFGIFENLLFHADPHPSNVLLKPNNKLVFIDFGSCGAYTTRERNNWRQLAYYQHKEDIGRMVQSAMAILEPLPSIDIDDFGKKLEAVFWRDLYAFRSKHSEWWERTSARTWISFLELANEYKIPMNLNTLRMIRSTLLYETVAARLYPHIDAYREHRKYNQKAGERARKRVNRAIQKRLFGGFTDTDYLRIEQLMQMGNRFLYLTQRVLDTPPYRFSLTIGKVAHAIFEAYKEIRFIVLSSISLFLSFIVWRLIFDDNYTVAQISFGDTMKQIIFYSTRLKVFWVVLVLVTLWLNWRRLRFRMLYKETHRNNTSGLS